MVNLPVDRIQVGTTNPKKVHNLIQSINAVAIRTGTVHRVWFAICTAMGIFLAIVREIFIFFVFYDLTLVKQQ